MIKNGDFYWIPVLPKELRILVAEKRLPKEKAAEYKSLRSAFTASKDEFVRWAYRDRHQSMSKSAKAVLAYLARCLNFDTGRCDPSQQTIADELGMGLRSVGRAVRDLVKAGWIEVVRRGLTTSNFYRLRVPIARIEAIEEDLSARKMLRQTAPAKIDADDSCLARKTESAGPHQPEMADQDKPILADQDKPGMADKPMNRTSESEPLNKKDINQREGNYRTEVGDRGPGREKIPASAKIISILPRLPPASREEDFPRWKEVEWHGETTSYGPPFKQAFNERERLL